jgi:hypothetical protein
MTAELAVKDLIVLAADGQMEATVRGLLTHRRPSLQIREITADIYVHPEKDPGCLLRGHDFLRPFCRQYQYTLILCDRDGCGQQDRPREALEEDIERRLAISGWEGRAAAVVLDPELEIWVWSDSPKVDQTLGWTGRQPSLANWLVSEGYCTPSHGKPNAPKRAFEEALQIAKRRRSSAIYHQLARQVGLSRCTDPSFLKLKALLRRWFGKAT